MVYNESFERSDVYFDLAKIRCNSQSLLVETLGGRKAVRATSVEKQSLCLALTMIIIATNRAFAVESPAWSGEKRAGSGTGNGGYCSGSEL